MTKKALDILENNDAFIAINKPSGLLSIPDRIGKDPSLKKLLEQQFGKIFTVHRLDKDTSGVIVFAKNETAHKQLSALFEGRFIQKKYLGLVYGIPMEESGSINAPIMEHPANNATMLIHANGKPALTDYKVLETFKRFAWMEFQIHTGRTHQIRVHCQYIGHSIVCDEIYGDSTPVLVSSFKSNYKLSKHDDEERPILSRLALHAASLHFSLNGTDFALEAPIPKDLKALLQQLRK